LGKPNITYAPERFDPRLQSDLTNSLENSYRGSGPWLILNIYLVGVYKW
jgi:hypothetical protein